jgi:outer membrane protein OmpA-like peptidoglycan-associated protein
MGRILMTAAVLAVLVYAMVLGVKILSPRIEDDIANRVTAQLAKDNQLWAEVGVAGREVTLSGIAPDSSAQNAALRAVSRVFGVAKVTDATLVEGSVSATALQLGTLVEATAGKTVVNLLDGKEKPAAKAANKGYALTIRKVGDRVMLAGQVPSAADKDMLERLAVTHYGVGKVDVREVEIVAGAPAGWRVAAGSVLFNIVNLEDATATLAATKGQPEVMVSGTVLAPEFSAQMEEAVRAALPKAYKVAYAVETVKTPVAEVTATETGAKTAAKGSEVLAAAEDAALAAIEPAAGDAAGCEGLAEVGKTKLMFGFDKAELRAVDAPVVAKVGYTLKACHDSGVVTVAGFTDQTGSPLYNRWLSEQRAQAALRALLREGVERNQLKAVGYGEKNQVASNATKAGRAANRRVEFHVPAAAGTMARVAADKAADSQK